MTSSRERPAVGDQQRLTVVTGASRGIGRVTAEAIAASGSDLVIIGRDETALSRAATEIGEATSARVVPCQVDVADTASPAVLADLVAREFGRVDGLVNNAAILGPVGRIDTVDLGDWARALATNVTAVAAVVAALVPLMATTGGSIVNLSGGGLGGPSVQTNVSAYTASKAAIATLTETLAVELEPLGIRVNAIAPGPVATGFLSPVIDAGRERSGAVLFDAATHADVPSTPSRAFLDFVLFLLSDRSRSLTGRLLSARWDSPTDLERSDAPDLGPSRYRMRRIDGVLFAECVADEPGAGR